MTLSSTNLKYAEKITEAECHCHHDRSLSTRARARNARVVISQAPALAPQDAGRMRVERVARRKHPNSDEGEGVEGGFSTIIETRRFKARPSGLSLPSAFLFAAIGYCSPKPFVVILVQQHHRFSPANPSRPAPARAKAACWSPSFLWNRYNLRPSRCFPEIARGQPPPFLAPVRLLVLGPLCHSRRGRHRKDSY